jgi:hypothetical protein
VIGKTIQMTMRYAYADEKHLDAMAKKFSVPKSVTTTVEAAESEPAGSMPLSVP